MSSRKSVRLKRKKSYYESESEDADDDEEYKPPVEDTEEKFSSYFCSRETKVKNLDDIIGGKTKVRNLDDIISGKTKVRNLDDIISGKTRCNLSDSDSEDDTDGVEHSRKASTVSGGNEIDSENENESGGFQKESVSSEYFDFTPLLSSQSTTVEEKNTSRRPDVDTSSNKADNNFVVDNKDVASQMMDVSQLLCLGENIKLPPAAFKVKSSSNTSKNTTTTVEEDEKQVEEEYKIPDQVDVFLKVPDHMKHKKRTDLERALNRRLNMVKQENQMYVHKASVLCWIAYGNSINSILNDTEILSVALSLLPSDRAYPKKHADLKYLEDLLNWFNKKVKYYKNDDVAAADKVDNNNMSRGRQSLTNRLKRHFETLTVTDRKFAVFMFVAIARALGLKARLVINLNVCPVKLTKNDLMPVLLGKKEDNDQKFKKQTDKINKEEDKLAKKCNAKKTERTNKSTDDDDKNEKNKKLTSGKLFGDCKETKSVTIKMEVVEEIEDDQSCSSSKYFKSAATSSSDSRSDGRKTTKKSTVGGEKSRYFEEPAVAVKIKKEKTDEKETSSKYFKPTRSTSKKIDQVDKQRKSLESPNNGIGVEDVSLSKKDEQNLSVNRRSSRTSTKLNEIDEGRRNNNNNNRKSNGDKIKEPVINKSRYFKTSSQKDSAEFGNEKLEKKSDEYFEDVDRAKTSSKIRRTEISVVDEKMTLRTRKKPPAERQSAMSASYSSKKESKNKTDFKQNDDKLRRNERFSTKNGSNKTSSTNRLDRADSSSDSDFEPVTLASVGKKKTIIDRRVLSSDDETSAAGLNKSDVKRNSKMKSKNENHWTEVYLEDEESWISVDVVRGRYHCTDQIYNNATQPVRYIFAWNVDQTIKDVTRRYDPNWLTKTQKSRASSDWCRETLLPYKPENTPQDRNENDELDVRDVEQPLPTSISDYKNHPLYVLERHLLKFQAIYPPTTTPLGRVRDELVYPRSTVHQLHGREMWIKEAKVVRVGEKPYKIVKGRPKKELFKSDSVERKDIELFGTWQVDDYEPPVAKNGIVPRNAFGNVDLFKECMLPKGTVHLKLPGLTKVANKLQIDCAGAITGFEFSNGFSYPVKEGFVVCEEFVDVLIDAYNTEIREKIMKEKREAKERARKLWRKAFKLIRIRKKLKRKYNFDNLDNVSASDAKCKRKIVKNT